MNGSSIYDRIMSRDKFKEIYNKYKYQFEIFCFLKFNLQMYKKIFWFDKTCF